MSLMPLVLAAALVLSPEIEITAPVLQPVGNAFHPDVASDGTDFFVIWKQVEGDSNTLAGARVTGNGQLLDPRPRTLGAATKNAAWLQSPEVRVAGGRYLIARPRFDGLDVLAVETDGTVVATTPLESAFGTGLELRTASNGVRMLVTWNTIDAIRGAIVDRDARVVGRFELPRGRVEGAASSADGNEFLVATGSGCAGAYCAQSISLTRVSIGGHILAPAVALDASTVPNARGFDRAAVARAGSGSVVFARVLTGADGSSTAGLWAYVFDADGAPVGEPISVLGQAPPIERMRALSDRNGNAVLVLETFDRTIVATLDATTRAVSTRTLETDPQTALAFASGSTLLVSIEHSYASKLTGRFVTSDFSIDPSRPGDLVFSTAAPQQDWPVVGTNGKVFLVAWNGAEMGGAILDRNGRRISAPFKPQIAHFVASDGDGFLLGGMNRVQRVSAAGELLDPELRYIGDFQTNIDALVWNGSSYVAFTTASGSALSPPGHVDAIRISRTGEELDRKPISARTGGHTNALAAFDGETTLVLWKKVIGCERFCTPIVHIDGAFVDAENNVLGTLRLTNEPIDPYTVLGSLSYGGGEFLLTYWDLQAREARAMRISRTETVIADTLLEKGVLSSAPVAAWNGTTFDIAWVHQEPEFDGDLMFRRGAAVAIADSGEPERAAKIAAIPNGTTLLVYARHINDELHGSTSRVFARTVVVTPAKRRRAVTSSEGDTSQQTCCARSFASPSPSRLSSPSASPSSGSRR